MTCDRVIQQEKLAAAMILHGFSAVHAATPTSAAVLSFPRRSIPTSGPSTNPIERCACNRSEAPQQR